MGIRRTSVIACMTAGLWLGACSSDAKTSTTGSTAATTTTQAGLIAATTTAGSAAAPAATTTTAASGATATTTRNTTTRNTTTGSTTTASTTTASTTAARVVTSPSDNVKLGDSGSGVKQIQTALKAQGYAVTVDGTFGPKTDTAVKAFQKKNGLKQDGVVGPKTWAKLSGSGTTTTTIKSSGSTATTSVATSTSIKG